MAFKETEKGSENNFTITFPSNTTHKSLSTKLFSTMNLFKQLNQTLEFTELKLSNCKKFHLIACLPTLINLPPKRLGIQPPFVPPAEFISVHMNLSCYRIIISRLL